MIKKFTIYNLQFTILIATAIFHFSSPVFAQTCTTSTSDNTVVNGLVTAPYAGTNSIVSGSGACAIDPKTQLNPDVVPTFESLKVQYYDNPTKLGVSKFAPSPPPSGKFTQNDISTTNCTNYNDNLYYLDGNLEISGLIGGTQTKLVFVTGNLTIGNSAYTEVTYPSSPAAAGTAGIVYVVNGDVNIHKDVIKVDGLIISDGVICTAYNESCPGTNIKTSQLTINGSLVSLNKEEPNPLRFKRELNNNNQPAEVIIHQIKYLAILKNVLSDSTPKWSEIDTSTPVPPVPPIPIASEVQTPPAATGTGAAGEGTAASCKTYQQECHTTPYTVGEGGSCGIITCPSNAPNETCPVNTCHGDIYGYGGTCTPNSVLICASNISEYVPSQGQTIVCGQNNIYACYSPTGSITMDGSIPPRRLYYIDQTPATGATTCNKATCGFPYQASSGNHDAICGATFTGTINGVSGSWDDVIACNADGTLKKYYTGAACTQTGTCNWPKPISCDNLDANLCHADVTGYTGLSCNPTAKTCLSNISSYVPSKGQTAVCGSSNISACNTDNSLKTYYTGTFTGTVCTQASCGYPYSPSGNQGTACSPACANSTTPNKYYDGTKCTQTNCPFPQAATCPTNICHGDVYGYNGTNCSNNHLICSSNAASYANQSTICGASNSTACSGSTLKTYYTGTVTGTACNQATCSFPYSPGGNQSTACSPACANSTTLNTYYPGNSCSQNNCGYPPALDCTALDANGCHDSISGYNGLSCNPTAKTCPSNYTTYTGFATVSQSSVCGQDNTSGCNTNGTLKTYDAGTSCSTTSGTCGYPYSPAPGQQTSICGTRTGSNDANGCSGLGGSLRTYWPGNSCSQTNCLPNPAVACPTTTCHGDIYGYNGTTCANSLICSSNAASYANQSAICGTNNTTACSGSSLKTYYTGTVTGTSCNTASCGYPYSPGGNHDSICASNNSNGCADSVNLKTYYPGNSCSQTGCGYPPAIDCVALNSSCHNSVSGYNGTSCNSTAKTCVANYPAADACPTTCHAGTVYVFNGDTCNTAIKNKACAGNAPAAQSCPTSCHTDTQYVNDGNCGQTTCSPNAPAAQSCPSTCHTDTQYVSNGACGQTTCGSNAPAAQSCPSSCHTDTQYVSNGACGQTTCGSNAPAAQSCPSTCHTDTQYVPNGSCGSTTCPPNPPAANSLPPVCRTSSYNYYNGSTCGPTTTYTANCFKPDGSTGICNSDGVGCYVNSSLLYAYISDSERQFHWVDRWTNKSTNTSYNTSSSYFTATLSTSRVNSSNYDWDNNSCNNVTAAICLVSSINTVMDNNLTRDGISRTKPTTYPWINPSLTDDGCNSETTYWGYQYCNNIWHSVEP